MPDYSALLSVLGGVSAGAVGLPPALGSSLGGALGTGLDNKSGTGGGDGVTKQRAGQSGGAGGMNMDPSGMAALSLGAIQKVAGMIRQKKAKEAFPYNEDPELRALAQNAARRKRAFQTGTALNSQSANIQALQKQGINAAFQAGGGMAGINKLAQITQQAMLGLNNQALQGEMAFGQQENDIVNKLAQTRLEKAMLRYNQANADAKQTMTNANRNMMYGLAKTLPAQKVDPSNAASYPAFGSTAAVPKQKTLTYNPETGQYE